MSGVFPFLMKLHGNDRKQPPEVFYKKCVLKNFTKFTGKHLCQSLFFNEVTVLRPATLSKIRLWHRCFPVNFVKFSRTPFLQNTSGRLLLNDPSFASKELIHKYFFIFPKFSMNEFQVN